MKSCVPILTAVHRTVRLTESINYFIGWILITEMLLASGSGGDSFRSTFGNAVVLLMMTIFLRLGELEWNIAVLLFCRPRENRLFVRI